MMEVMYMAKKRGFALMKETDPKRQREIASAGGRRAHELHVAHEWDSAEATKAGRLGGSSK